MAINPENADLLRRLAASGTTLAEIANLLDSREQLKREKDDEKLARLQAEDLRKAAESDLRRVFERLEDARQRVGEAHQESANILQESRREAQKIIEQSVGAATQIRTDAQSIIDRVSAGVNLRKQKVQDEIAVLEVKKQALIDEIAVLQAEVDRLKRTLGAV